MDPNSDQEGSIMQTQAYQLPTVTKGCNMGSIMQTQAYQLPTVTKEQTQD